MDESSDLHDEEPPVAAAQDEEHAIVETTPAEETSITSPAQEPASSTETPVVTVVARSLEEPGPPTTPGVQVQGPKPRIRISISTNQEHHLLAALSLSSHLDEFGIKHAYIGGFAWALLGSSRPTQDIDVLIECSDLSGLHEKLKERDVRFTGVMFKLYYVTQEFDESAAHEQSEDLVLRSRDNVLVETLRTGTMGLPVTITTTYSVAEVGVRLLHPSILILTKLKRWSTSYTSTRLKTMRKVASDNNDIRFMIGWLSENDEQIWFDEYQGKTKPELLVMLRTYYNKYVGDGELMVKLQSIMHDSWDEMLALPQLEEESNLPPPPSP
ncbi:hypothetical protein C8Q70DRAFT_376124 [Cubamyces menziesii]|nr:hypothetical protein C8Q70DRAFT_376124 [Cubamyces menziesii]